MEAVTVLQSMGTSYERGLIRNKSLKHQSLNMFLVINYCLQGVCICMCVYKVLGPLKKKIMYLTIITLVIMIEDLKKKKILF